MLLLWREPLKDYEIDTVYFGGGTPSLLEKEDWERLLGAMRENFSFAPDCEITAEMNPETVTAEKLAAFTAFGGNRLSLGMQSANQTELARIGRKHSPADCERAVALARRAGIRNVSLDLIFALPEQTEKGWLQNLETAMSFSPEHLSFYCLTLAEHVPLYAQRSALPSEEEQQKMYCSGIGLLEKHGYLQYEISNAARPGFESRHNLKYWRREEYLGIGPGAHSFFGGKRFSFAADVHRFLTAKKWEDALETCEAVLPADAAEERIMLSLRLAEGLNLAGLEREAGAEKRFLVEKKLSALLPHGLCRKTETGYALTPKGFFVSNEIISQLI